MYSRRVRLPHHVHEHDERACGYGHASSKRRTKPPERRNHSSVQVQKARGNKFDTCEAEPPKGNTAKRCISVQFTQDLDTHWIFERSSLRTKEEVDNMHSSTPKRPIQKTTRGTFAYQSHTRAFGRCGTAALLHAEVLRKRLLEGVRVHTIRKRH